MKLIKTINPIMKSKWLKVIFYSLVLSSALSAQKTEFETVLQVPDSDRM